MDTGIHRFSPAQVNGEDKYMASIELSNACRQFYKSRLEEAHSLKTRWQKQARQTRCSTSNDNDRPAKDSRSSNSSSSCDNRPQRTQRSSIDVAMDRLRAEMTSLMDQDLSLMKQLLTLNETIEDLKWQRRYYCSPRSSADLDDSDCSISDTEMYESEDDLLCRLHPSSTTSSSSSTTAAASTASNVPVPATSVSSTSCRRHSVSGLKGEMRCAESQGVVVGESTVVVYHHGEQDSFDSGIHESCSSEEEVLEASV